MKTVSALTTTLILAAAGLAQAQVLLVDKSTLSFSAQSSGAAVSQTLSITGTATAFSLAVNPPNSWLKVNPSTGATPSGVTVTADPAGLLPSNYSGTITLFGGTGTPPIVQVTFSVGSIGVTPQSVAFAYTQGGTVPGLQSLTLTGTPTNFNAVAATTSGGAWLQVSPPTGSSPGAIQVSLSGAIVQSLPGGTYNGTVTITPTSGSLPPVVVAVTLTVTAAPPVTANPSTVNLNFQIGGLNNTAQTLTLSTTGTLALNYGLTPSVDFNPSGANWILASPLSGTIPAAGSIPVTVSYDATKNLPASVVPYTGKLALTAPGGAPAQQDISVRLLVSSSPLLNVPGATLAFNHQVGGASPAPKTVTATSTAVLPGSATGQMTLSISASTNNTGNWLTVPAIAATGTPFSVSVSPAGLAPGNYSGTITVIGFGAGNAPQTIPVTLAVANDPQIVMTVNGCSTLAQSCPVIFPVQTGQLPPAIQTVPVTSSTGASISYTATTTAGNCPAGWFTLGGATAGSTAGSFTVMPNAALVPAGTALCNGTIVVSGVNAASGASTPNSPVTIPVTMYISATALISVTPSALNFSVQLGGNPTPQAITVNSTSPTEQLTYTVTTSTASGWLIAGPNGSTASGSNVITVFVQPGLLSAGTYTGSVTITATNPSGAPVADSPVTIPVTLTVNAGVMSATPATLSFTQTLGGAVPAAQTITVASGGQPLNWSAAVLTGGTGNWLTIAPAGGSTPGTITVTANGSALTPGTYNGTVTITSLTAGFSGSPATVNVQLVVTAGALTAAPTSLNFTQAQNGPAPATQTVAVSGAPGAIAYNVTTNATVGSWLSATPASGTTPGTVTVGASGAGLAPGTYTGTVTITPTGGGTAVNIPVTLTMAAAQTLSVSSASVSFSYAIGNPAPVAQTVSLTSSGGVAQFTRTVNVSGGGSWLSVSPASGSTPATLSVSVNPAGLAAGNYIGTVSIASPQSASQVAASITVNLSVVATVPPALTVVRNNASFSVGAIAAGENVWIGGTNLGPATIVVAQPAAGAAFPTTVSETQVTFDGIAAPVYYASALQTSVFVPYEIAGRPTTTIRVIYKGVSSEPLTVNVAASAPGIYTRNSMGSGPGAILNQNFSYNTDVPAAKGSVVAVYMTGEGATSPTPANGTVAPLDGTGLFRTTLPVAATVGGIPAIVRYHGSAPGAIYGFMQANVEIPANAPSGPAVPIVITVGGVPTQNGVTVSIQ